MSSIISQCSHAYSIILFYLNGSRKNVLTVTIHPVQTGLYEGQPTSRCYQICLPNFWPGTHLSVSCCSLALIIIVVFFTANGITITGSDGSLPQTPLMDIFDEYTQDSWTYDGRYSVNIVIPFTLYFIIEIL